MKVVLVCLIFIVALVNEADGAVHAHAEMYLAGTNDFIGTVNFYEEQVAWGVVITGYVNHLRPSARLVSSFLHLS